MPTPPQNLSEFQALVQIVADLRGPQGCPWDKEQTHQTLTQFVIEETHELVEAIEKQDPAHMAEELGDLLLQVVLHAQLAKEAGHFDIHDVMKHINEKMVRRHPHVYGDTAVRNTDEVLQNWSKIKQSEKESKQQKTRIFDVPLSLPALQRAQKIGQKTKKYNFDWSSPQEVFAKVDEEIEELKQALTTQQKAQITHEIGDVLFSVAQLARHLDLDSEQCLRGANQRFESRFEHMHQNAESQQRKLTEMTPQELEELWSLAKKST